MWLVQAGPDDPIALLDSVRHRPGLAGNSLTGIERWNANTRAIRRVGPAVVGADQIPVFDPSQGERCPAVDAQIFEGDDPMLYPEDDNLLVEQARSERLVTELTAGRHRMPVVSQDRVRHGSPPESECHRSVYSMTREEAFLTFPYRDTRRSSSQGKGEELRISYPGKTRAAADNFRGLGTDVVKEALDAPVRKAEVVESGLSGGQDSSRDRTAGSRRKIEPAPSSVST